MAKLLLVLGHASAGARAAIQRQMDDQWPSETREFARGAFMAMLSDAPVNMLREYGGYKPGNVEATFDLSEVEASYLEEHYKLPVSKAAVVILDTEVYEAWCNSEPRLAMKHFSQAVGIFVTPKDGSARFTRIK